MAQAAATLEEESPVAHGAATVTTAAASITAASTTAASTIEHLQQRIRSMQATKLDSRLIPTHPALADLLPGGGLKQGVMYSVENSATLLLALLAGPSAAGSWCGVVGVPEFGVEAAASFGIDLERLVLVPQPGDQWLAVTAAIADVMTVVVTKPPRVASEGNLARLAARLRQRGSTLIVVGSHSAWPQSEAMLSLSQSSWSGIGDGDGHLTARQVTVTVSQHAGGRPRSARMWLPDPELRFARVEAVSTSSTRDGTSSTRGNLRAVG
ncbi:MAG TPA: hypothetical protein VK537_07825 [Galbitalea sp.]|nr:hypothetical protein [Galbitalea sp.]